MTVDLVLPAPDGFTFEGTGSDGADYRMEMRLRVQPPLRARLRRQRSAGRSGS